MNLPFAMISPLTTLLDERLMCSHYDTESDIVQLNIICYSDHITNFTGAE